MPVQATIVLTDPSRRTELPVVSAAPQSNQQRSSQGKESDGQLEEPGYGHGV